MGFCSILLNLFYLDLHYEGLADVIISSMTFCSVLFILGYVFIWQWFIYLFMFAYSQDSVILKPAYIYRINTSSQTTQQPKQCRKTTHLIKLCLLLFALL